MKSTPASSVSRSPGRVGWRMWVLALLFAIAIGAGGWSHFKRLKTEARRATEESLNSIADLKSGEIVAWMKERRGDAEVGRSSLIAQRLLEDPDNPKSRDAARRLVEIFQQAYDYDAVAIFDSRGNPRLVVPADGLRPFSGIGEEVQMALNSREVMLVDLHRDQPTEPVHLTFLGPIGVSPQTNQPANGVIALVVDPSRFLYPLVQSWPTPSKSAETMLIRREGNEVLYLNELHHQKNTALTLRLPITPKSQLPAALAVEGFEGFTEGRDYRDIPVLAAMRRIPDTPWFMVAKVDQDEVYATTRKDAWLAGTCFGLILLSAMLGLGLLWRQQKLAFALRELAEHRRAEASEQRFQTLIEESPIAIRLSRIGKTLYANKKFLEQYGFANVGEIVGHPILEQWAPDSRRIIEERTRKRSSSEQVPPEFEGVGQRKDGSQFPVLGTATEVELSDGMALISFMADITDRKRAEDKIHQLNVELEQRVTERTAELAEANKELEAFSYSVSHDLRAPLRHVNGFVDLLRQQVGGSLDAKSTRFLDIIAGSAHKMSLLIDDLLAFSRTSRAAMRMDAVSLEQLLQEVLKDIHAETQGRQIAWKIGKLPDVHGDRAMLRQVLVNLIGNAVKYSRARQQAEIEIGAECRGSDHIVFVKDNGAGFDMRYVEKLFGVFQRLHSDEEFEGTGIGLALVRRIISRHGGRTWAEGKVDEGATFWFTLPVSRMEKPEISTQT